MTAETFGCCYWLLLPPRCRPFRLKLGHWAVNEEILVTQKGCRSPLDFHPRAAHSKRIRGGSLSWPQKLRMPPLPFRQRPSPRSWHRRVSGSFGFFRAHHGAPPRPLCFLAPGRRGRAVKSKGFAELPMRTTMTLLPSTSLSPRREPERCVQ